MGKITKLKTKGSERMLKNTKKLFKKSSHESKLKKNIKNKTLQQRFSIKKENTSIIRNKQVNPISSLIDTVGLDMNKLNHEKQIKEQGAREVGTKKPFPQTTEVQEMELAELKEKQTQEQESGQVATKKPFPGTIEGLVKELVELKGTPMSREKKLRRKGLRSRLVKKRRKEERRLKRAAMKLAKKQKLTITCISQTDSNVVSSKVDSARTDMKEDNKKKPGAVNSKMILSQSLILPKMINIKKNKFSKGNPKSNVKCNSSKNSTFKTSPAQKGEIGRIVKKTKFGPKNNVNSTTKQGPIPNKGNKIVLGRVYVPKNHKEFTKSLQKKIQRKSSKI